MALDDPHAQPSEPPGNDGPHDDPATRDAAPFAGDQALPCGRLLSKAWEQAQDATRPPIRTPPHAPTAARPSRGWPR